MKRTFAVALSAVAVMGLASTSFAAITLPTLPTTDLEAAITAVLALVAVAVVGGMVIRMLKKG